MNIAEASIARLHRAERAEAELAEWQREALEWRRINDARDGNDGLADAAITDWRARAERAEADAKAAHVSEDILQQQVDAVTGEKDALEAELAEARATIDSFRLELDAARFNAWKDNEFLIAQRDQARATIARVRDTHKPRQPIQRHEDPDTCPDCGHHHAGPELAGICVGCPCRTGVNTYDAERDEPW